MSHLRYYFTSVGFSKSGVGKNKLESFYDLIVVSLKREEEEGDNDYSALSIEVQQTFSSASNKFYTFTVVR